MSWFFYDAKWIEKIILSHSMTKQTKWPVRPAKSQITEPSLCAQWIAKNPSFLHADKTKKVNVRPAKTQISLDILPIWSESSLWAQWVAKDPSFLHADSKDSDQTGQTPRLIWVFAGRTFISLVLSCRGSIVWRRLCWYKNDFVISSYRYTEQWLCMRTMS